MIDRESRRRHRRIATLRTATLETGGRRLKCVVRDVSAGGARLKLLGRGVASGTAATLEIPGVGAFAGLVAWCLGGELGLHFADDSAGEAAAGALETSDIADVLGFVAAETDGHGPEGG